MDWIRYIRCRLRAALPLGAAPLVALVLASCSIETEPGPGARDSSVGSDADAAGDAGGDSGAGGREDAGSGGNGGRAGEGGRAGGAGDAGAAGDSGQPECDATQSPKDEPCLVDDERAVFVASDGDDDADGSMAEPMATLDAAVARAVQRDIDRVIVCGGLYEQAFALTEAVSVYGGFECDEMPWRYAQTPTLVQPASPGEALRIEDVGDRVIIEDMQFTARDAPNAGASSIAAIVRDSDDVVLRRVQLEAGTGASGAAGATVPFAFPKTGAAGNECADPMMMCLAGKAADGNNGGSERTYTCPDGDATVGGLGGDSVPTAEAGQPGLPDLGLGGGGEGGTSPGNCQSGTGGAVGPAGSTGLGGAAGTLSDAQWHSSSGANGMPGNVGQGGGGGGALAPVGGGGGGGAGGCGGAGGVGGQGGGASIALLGVSSTIALEDCALHAAAGGDGGSGADGQPGMTSGGIGGAGASCGGGAGGAGGKGGAGGGGAGGLSAGIVWTGTEPMQDGTDFDLGAPGRGGSGGDTTVTEDDGANGTAVEVLAM